MEKFNTELEAKEVDLLIFLCRSAMTGIKDELESTKEGEKPQIPDNDFLIHLIGIASKLIKLRCLEKDV